MLVVFPKFTVVLSFFLHFLLSGNGRTPNEIVGEFLTDDLCRLSLPTPQLEEDDPKTGLNVVDVLDEQLEIEDPKDPKDPKAPPGFDPICLMT